MTFIGASPERAWPSGLTTAFDVCVSCLLRANVSALPTAGQQVGHRTGLLSPELEHGNALPCCGGRLLKLQHSAIPPVHPCWSLLQDDHCPQWMLGVGSVTLLTYP